jgi:hypothetical protein
MWEVGLSPSPVEFSSLHNFYKLSCSWLLGVCCRSCLLWPACLFTVQWGIPLPPIWRSGLPTLFATCLYCSYCLILSFSFFPWVGGRCVQGAMLIWPRVVCGSTTYRLTHLVPIFPSHLGAGIWQRPGGPPGFSI